MATNDGAHEGWSAPILPGGRSFSGDRAGAAIGVLPAIRQCTGRPEQGHPPGVGAARSPIAYGSPIGNPVPAIHPPITGADPRPTGWRDRRCELLTAAALLALLVATNRWMSWRGGAVLLTAHDEHSYRQIALAAPSLPGSRLANQYAQLFALNYLVGLIHAGLGVGIDLLFRVVSLVLIGLICWTLTLALRRTGVSTPAFAVCLGVFVLNTYALRYYLLALGYVTDLSFVLAIAMISLALICERFWLALLGIVLATLARQSALPVTFALAGIFAFAPPWRLADARVRWSRVAAVLLIPWLLFAALLAVSASFSAPTTPGVKGLTIVGAVERLPSGVGALAEHLVRVSNPLFILAALLIVALIARARLVSEHSRPRPALWTLPVLGLSVWLQPVALNPSYSAHPERLAVMSLGPFVIALGLLLADAERSGAPLTPRRAVVLVAIITAGSLQYLYTWFGPATALQGALLQFIAALAAGFVAWQGLSVTAAGVGGERLA